MEIPDYKHFARIQLGENYIKKHYSEFYNFIMNKYQLPFKESFYLYMNNLEEKPKCKCGKYTKFIDYTKGYRKYCSLKCANSDEEKKENQKNNFLQKYGVENPSQLEEVKQKKKETTLLHYGVENPLQLKEVKEKIKQNNLKKYGVEYPMQSIELKEKIKQNNLEKYGIEWYTNREKCNNTIKEKYGVEYGIQLKSAKINYSNNSKPNIEFEKLLIENNIKYEREYPLENYKYDFKIDNILVEINPTGTHNSTFGIFNKSAKDKNYHLNKTIIANNNNYKCIHVWDWDDINKIINILKHKDTINARKCIIKEIDKKTCDDFLNKYHLQNTCRNQKIRIGLYHENELVEVMTFGKPRYNKNIEYELLRLCSHKDYLIIGGSQKLFKYFLINYHPNSIISYCDLSKFDGNIYEKLGFKSYKKNKPSKHWSKKNIHITDNFLKQRGFDQLFHTDFGKGTSNQELMIKNNFLEVYDCGQKTFIWKQ